MTRPTLLVVAMLALAGCQAEHPAAPADPFLFGPTRVPPPGTGAVAPQPGLSSNRPAATGVVSTPASDPKNLAVAVRSMPAPTFGGPAQTPAAGGAVTPAGDQIKIPDAARKLDTPDPLVAGNNSSTGSPIFHERSPATPPATTSNAPSSAISGSGSPGSSPASTVADRRSDPLPSGQDRVVQTLLPRSQASSAPSQFAPTGGARPLQAPAASGGNKSNVVDIDDLPAATPTGQPQTSYHPNTIQLVSGIEEIGSRYGYDPQYGWLRGKLEFSESDRQWKLRYIPIDGATDNYGGSVILADTPLLSGYERGDFVEVAGKLISASSEKRGYAPKYQVSQLQRLAN
jgi:hypothetical protein